MKKNIFAGFMFVVYLTVAGVWFNAIFADVAKIAQLS